jgi:hypothetical protein
MSGEPFNELNLGVPEKYEAVFSAIHSGNIFSATEAELAVHTRALASYHSEHAGQDQLAAALLIHGLQLSRASAKIDRKTNTLIRLTWALIGLTAVLLVFTMVLK